MLLGLLRTGSDVAAITAIERSLTNQLRAKLAPLTRTNRRGCVSTSIGNPKFARLRDATRTRCAIDRMPAGTRQFPCVFASNSTGVQAINPARTAATIAWARVRAPNFKHAFETYSSTVRGEIPSRRAISGEERPSAMSFRQSSCRRLRRTGCRPLGISLSRCSPCARGVNEG